MRRFSQTIEWLRGHPFMMWLALLLPGGFTYGATQGILRGVWNLRWVYVLPIAVPPALIVVVLLYAWIASRPHPETVPPLRIVLEAGTAWLLPNNPGGGIVACRFSVRNNVDRELRIVHARLRTSGIWGRAEMFDGAVRRGNPDAYFQSQPRVSEIAKDKTEMVFCIFSGPLAVEIAQRKQYEDVVELYDDDENCNERTVTFLPASTPPVDLPAPLAGS